MIACLATALLLCVSAASEPILPAAKQTLGIIRCGIAPIPPIGCRYAACVCDPAGRCQWTFAAMKNYAVKEQAHHDAECNTGFVGKFPK